MWIGSAAGQREDRSEVVICGEQLVVRGEHRGLGELGGQAVHPLSHQARD